MRTPSMSDAHLRQSSDGSGTSRYRCSYFHKMVFMSRKPSVVCQTITSGWQFLSILFCYFPNSKERFGSFDFICWYAVVREETLHQVKVTLHWLVLGFNQLLQVDLLGDCL